MTVEKLLMGLIALEVVGILFYMIKAYKISVSIYYVWQNMIKRPFWMFKYVVTWIMIFFGVRIAMSYYDINLLMYLLIIFLANLILVIQYYYRFKPVGKR